MFIFYLFPFRMFALLMRIAFTPVVPHGPGGGSPRYRYEPHTNKSIREAVEMWCTNEAKAKEVYGPIEDWNTSNVTCMKALFKHRRQFNENIGGWDTSKVTDMSYMFYNGTHLTPMAFNKPLDWDTSKVTNMRYMFAFTSAFNQPLNWDTSKVTDMHGMFYEARAFNQPITFSDTSCVTNMSYMFYGAAAFNQLLSFDTSSVTDMSGMFAKAAAFNQLLKFNTSKVTDMNSMFYEAWAFNQPLTFDTSNVTNMSSMFYRAEAFNQPLSFDTSKVTTMHGMFYKAAFDQHIKLVNWEVNTVSQLLRPYQFSNGVVPLLNERPQLIKYPFCPENEIYLYITLNELYRLDVFKSLFPCLRPKYKPPHSNDSMKIVFNTTWIANLILSHLFELFEYDEFELRKLAEPTNSDGEQYYKNDEDDDDNYDIDEDDEDNY